MSYTVVIYSGKFSTLHMTLLFVNSILFVGPDPCSWMTSGRVWEHSLKCQLSRVVDLHFSDLRFPNSDVSQTDMTVVNVFSLAADRRTGHCSFSVLQTRPSASLKNGLFVFNATLNLSQYNCSDAWISPFDSAQGSFQNVSVIGNISVINAGTTSLKLSSFFGSLLRYDATRSNSQNPADPLFNLSSSLQYFVNGNAILADNQSVAGQNVRLISDFDSMSAGISKINIPSYGKTLQDLVS